MYIIEVKLFYIINGLVHFQNKNLLIIYSPNAIQNVHVFLYSVEKRFFEENITDIFSI